MARGFVGCWFFLLLWLFVFRVLVRRVIVAGAKVAGRPVGRVGTHWCACSVGCGMRGAVGMDGLVCGMAAVGREVRERIMSADPAGLGVVERRVRARLDAMSVQWWHGVTIVRYAPMWGAVRYRVFAGEWTAEQIVFDGKARELGAVRCRAEHNHRAAWYGVDAFDWSFTAEEALRKLLFAITGRHARIS